MGRGYRDIGKADRLGGPVGVGTGDPGDSDRQVRAEARTGALRHGLRHLAADRADTLKQSRGNTELAALHLVGVGDHAAEEIRGAPRLVGDQFADEAAGARLGDGYCEPALAEELAQIAACGVTGLISVRCPSARAGPRDVERRDQVTEPPEIVETAPDGEGYGDANRDVCQRDNCRIGSLQDQQSDGTNLHDGLGLAERGRADHTALSRCNRTQNRDDQLAGEDHDHDPRRDQAFLDEDDQHGKDEELVREWIEELSEVAHGPPPARDLPVQDVGEGKHDEQRSRQLVVTRETQHEQQHQGRNRRQPAQSQHVGAVHRAYGEVCDEKSRVATPLPIAPIGRPSMVMKVADALPLVIFMSTPAKYTIEPAGSVLPASAYWGLSSTNTLIHTSSVTLTPSTMGRT